jgi:hypothetical protein
VLRNLIKSARLDEPTPTACLTGSDSGRRRRIGRPQVSASQLPQLPIAIKALGYAEFTGRYAEFMPSLWMVNFFSPSGKVKAAV